MDRPSHLLSNMGRLQHAQVTLSRCQYLGSSNIFSEMRCHAKHKMKTHLKTTRPKAGDNGVHMPSGQWDSVGAYRLLKTKNKFIPIYQNSKERGQSLFIVLEYIWLASMLALMAISPVTKGTSQPSVSYSSSGNISHASIYYNTHQLTL